MVIAELAAKLGLNIDQSGFNAGTAAIGNLKKGLMGLGLALGGVAVGFAAAVKRTADQGDKIDELSQQVGVNAQELQRMAYGAQFSGVSIEELASAMGFLAKKGVKDLRGGMLEIADQFQQLPDGGDKAKFAMEKFGRAGKALIPFLNEGREKIAALGDQAEASGAIMGDSMIKDSARFNDAVDSLSSSFTGFRNAITGPFLGPLAEAMEEMRKWADANREVIKTGIVSFLKMFGFGLRLVWKALKPVRVVMEWFLGSVNRLKALIILASAALLYSFVPAIVASTGATSALALVTTAWGQAVLLAGARAAIAAVLPVAGWILLIGLLLLFIEDIYGAMTGMDSFFGTWETYLKRDPKGSPFFEGIKDLVRWIAKAYEMVIKFNMLPINWLLGKFPERSDVGGQLNAMTPEAQARVQRMQLQGYDLGRNMASASATPGAAPYYLSQPNTQASFNPNVTINAAGGDPTLIQNAVQTALDNVWNDKFNGVLRQSEGAVD